MTAYIEFSASVCSCVNVYGRPLRLLYGIIPIRKTTQHVHKRNYVVKISLKIYEPREKERKSNSLAAMRIFYGNLFSMSANGKF